MLDRDWVSIIDPESPYDRYVFDVSFLLSNCTCIYGAGCPGAQQGTDEEIGCCALGAYYMDDEDMERTEAMVEQLGPDWLQNYREARRRGVTADGRTDEPRTRVKDGACIFLNRGDFHTGAGCALHHYAVAHGEHHMTYKPEICWLVPLNRKVDEGVADDGETMWTTTITSFDRGSWGPGGASFKWWCTESPEAYVAPEPVYKSMEAELRELSSDSVYEELAAYLDERAASLPRPLPVLSQS